MRQIAANGFIQILHLSLQLFLNLLPPPFGDMPRGLVV